MQFLVTAIHFDFDADIDPAERRSITAAHLGAWEADDEDDLVEELTCASGWCVRSLELGSSQR